MISPCLHLISLGISAKAQHHFVEDYLDHINLSRSLKSLQVVNEKVDDGEYPYKADTLPEVTCLARNKGEHRRFGGNRVSSVSASGWRTWLGLITGDEYRGDGRGLEPSPRSHSESNVSPAQTLLDSRQRAVVEKANASTDSFRALNSPLWEGSNPSESAPHRTEAIASKEGESAFAVPSSAQAQEPGSDFQP